jgi:hypothetical protein
MFQSVYSQLSFVALIGCCGLALWKGGPAERGGGLLILATWLGTALSLAWARQYVAAGPFLLFDVILAAGLLVLAIRYSSLWVGAAMLLQAIGIGLHASYFAAEKADLSPHALVLYVMGKNLASYAMLLVILVGTLASWRKRVRDREAGRVKAGVTVLPGAAVSH